jgi:inorganic pyrophosphatase
MLRVVLFPILMSLFALGPRQESRVDPSAFPRSTVPLAEGLSFEDNLTLRAPVDFLRGHPARAENGLVNAVVEIPAGACEKWEVKLDGKMRWDMKDEKPRHVKYLGYPCNYGIVPNALLGKELGGDGDPLDMLVLGPALPRGTVLPVQVLGLIRLVDGGKKDDKLIAVPPGSPLAAATDLAQLDEQFPGITGILETWFRNYKGRDALQCSGFGDRADAEALLVQAIESFQELERAAK